MKYLDVTLRRFLSLSVNAILDMYLFDFIMLLFGISIVVISITILVIIIRGY